MKVSQGAASNGYHPMTSQLGPAELRSYPLKRWAKRLYLLVGAACAVLGSFLIVHSMTLPWRSSMGVKTGAVGLVLMGVYLCLSAFVYRVVLDRNSVAVKGVFRTRSLGLNEIKGRRIFSDRQGEYTVLEAKEPEGKTLAFSNYFDFDQEWFDWISVFDDLDAEYDLDAEALDAILKGIAESEKQSGDGGNRLKRARSIAISLSIFSFVAGLPLWIFGSSLNLDVFRIIDLLLVMLPWVVIAMTARWPAHYTLMAARSDPRPSLIVVLFGSGAGLMASPFANFRLDSETGLLLFACLPALGLAAALYRASPRTPRPVVLLIGLLVVSYFYGYGACSQINAQMDIAAPLHYSAVVAGKDVRNGRGANYHLFLTPGAPGLGAEDAIVSRKVYDEVQIGEAVCVTSHRGALHVPWHTVQGCK